MARWHNKDRARGNVIHRLFDPASEARAVCHAQFLHQLLHLGPLVAFADQPKPGIGNLRHGLDQDIEPLAPDEPSGAHDEEGIFRCTHAGTRHRLDGGFANEIGDDLDRLRPSQLHTGLGNARRIGDNEIVVTEILQMTGIIAEPRQPHAVDMCWNKPRGARHPGHHHIRLPFAHDFVHLPAKPKRLRRDAAIFAFNGRTKGCNLVAPDATRTHDKALLDATIAKSRCQIDEEALGTALFAEMHVKNSFGTHPISLRTRPMLKRYITASDNSPRDL